MKTRRKSRSSRLFHPHPQKAHARWAHQPNKRENKLPPDQLGRQPRTCLQTATTATTLATSRVGRNGGDVLDTTDSHAGTGEGTEGRLGTGTGGLGAGTTSGADLDVQGVDAELLAAGGNVLGGQHGGVGGGLVTVSLDLHTTGDTGDGFATTALVSIVRFEYPLYRNEPQIGDVDEGVVERGKDTGDTENELA